MTESFCATCNRLRLTAGGQPKACLFSSGEADLLTPLRMGATDRDIGVLIRLALAMKPVAHPPMEELLSLGNRAMVEIGG